jgi:hypothetical protein
VVPESGSRSSGSVYSLESPFVGVLKLLVVLVGDGEEEKERPGRLEDEEEEDSTVDVEEAKVFEVGGQDVEVVCSGMEWKDEEVGVDVAGSWDTEVEAMVLSVRAGVLRWRDGLRDMAVVYVVSARSDVVLQELLQYVQYLQH